MARSSREQFDAQAAHYATSSAHAAGPSLALLLALATPLPDDEALDVATGTGHTAFALAPLVHHVTGLDLSTGMLTLARERARSEGHRNLSFVVGDAEQLPQADSSLSLVTSRHAPHHFRDAGRFLREARRVLRPAGRLLLADQITPSPGLQDWVDRWHRAHDPSHHRQRTIIEWRALAADAGLRVVAERECAYRLDFASWTRTGGCTAQRLAELHSLAREATPQLRAAMGLEFDPRGAVVAYRLPVAVLRLERAS